MKFECVCLCDGIKDSISFNQIWVILGVFIPGKTRITKWTVLNIILLQKKDGYIFLYTYREIAVP